MSELDPDNPSNENGRHASNGNGQHASDAPDREFPAITHPRQRAFLAAFMVCGTVRGAARACGVSRQGHLNWLAASPDYADAFRQARETFADDLETEAIRRAREGTRKLVLYKGQPVMVPADFANPDGPKVPLYEHSYSDVLCIVMLKGLRPWKYADRQQQRTETAEGASLPMKAYADVDDGDGDETVTA